MKEKQALTTGDVARYCGVHFRTVTRWIQKGHLKAFHLPGRGDSRIFLKDFLDFLKANNISIPEELKEGATHLKALVIEDDAGMARSIKRTLTAMGLEAEIASDGFLAGAMIQRIRPDLITLDLNMPGLDGTSVLEIVRSLDFGKPIAVIVISGVEDQTIRKALRAGADGLLKKPFTKFQLEESVRAVMGAERLGGKHASS